MKREAPCRGQPVQLSVTLYVPSGRQSVKTVFVVGRFNDAINISGYLARKMCNLVNKELEKTWNRAIVSYSVHSTGICVQEKRRSHKPFI